MICVVPLEDFPVVGPFASHTEAESFCSRLCSWTPAEVRDMVSPDDWRTVWVASDDEERDL
jgi:hypothetical protein